MMNCQNLYLRIAPARIAFLRFILEGYDGLATLSTVDPRNGIVQVRYPHSSGKDVILLLNELAKQLV